LLKSFVLILFVVAWAAVAFAIVRGLVVAWGFDRRIALATAVAVAGAFALGAMSPFALSTLRPGASVPDTAAAPLPPPPAPRSVKCPIGAHISSKIAMGNVDVVTPDKGVPANNAGIVDVPAGTPLVFAGWAALTTGPANSLCTIVDGRLTANEISYNLPRPDVAATLGQPADLASGFNVTLHLPAGKHVVDVGAVEADGKTVDALKLPMTLVAH
jgi:hypothetical protein